MTQQRGLCPMRHLRENPPPLDYPWQHYASWERGILPHAGGWEDQPAVYCETVEILRALSGLREAAEAKEMREGQTLTPHNPHA